MSRDEIASNLKSKIDQAKTDFHVDANGTATASSPKAKLPKETPPTQPPSQTTEAGPGATPETKPKKPMSRFTRGALKVGGGAVGGAGVYHFATREPEPEYPSMGYQEYKGGLEEKSFKCVMSPESKPDLLGALARIGRLKRN